MLEELKAKVCKANIELYKSGIVLYTWGNVSGINREKGLVVIKPSGVRYESMKPEDMVVVDLAMVTSLKAISIHPLIYRLILRCTDAFQMLWVLLILIRFMLWHSLKQVDRFRFLERLMPITAA